MANIAIDARFLTRKFRGMPLYVYMLCKHIPCILHDHSFFLFVNERFEHNESEVKYKKIFSEIESRSNVQIVNSNAEDEMGWELFNLPKLIKKYNIDLLHMPGNRVCLTTSVTQIVTFHDAMEWKRLKLLRGFCLKKGVKSNLYNMKLKIYRWLIYRYGIIKAAQILTVSKSSKADLERYFPGLNGKIEYAYHGVPEHFHSEVPILGHKYRKGILMLGGDAVQKNPINAIKAWSLLPKKVRDEHPLTILGFTGDETSPIIKTAAESNIMDEIKIYGWVDNNFLFEKFSSSYLFLFLSFEEGFGFPLLQAMSRGTPSVCSTADVLAEIAGDGAIAVEPTNPTLIKKVMLDLIVDHQLWIELQQKSIERSSQFSWKNTCEKIANIYLRNLF